MDSLQQLLVLGAVACATIAYMLSRWLKPSFYDSLPCPPRKFIEGNLDLFLKGKIFENFLDASLKYGPLYALHVPTIQFACTSDAALASKCLQPGFAVKEPKDYWCLNQNTVPSCPNLLTASDHDPYWKIVRQAAAQAFSMRSLRSLFPDVVGTTCMALDGMRCSGEVEDLNNMMLRISMDVLGYFLLGRGFGGADRSDTRVLESGTKQMRVNHYLLVNPWFNFYFLWKKDVRECRRTIRQYDAWLQELVDELKASPPPAHTLGAQLLMVKDPVTGQPMSDLRLRSELSAFVFAGYESTGNTATIALFHIITHPEVESRVVEELATLGLLATPQNPTPRQVQWEDLAQLRVLTAAMLESMRILPVLALGSARVTVKDVEANGLRIPKGTKTWLQTITVHRNPANWEKPDEYIIDRFLNKDASEQEEGDVTSGRDKLKGFMPFSEGPRNCVGQALAKVEMLTILAQMLGRYKVELAPEMGGPQGFLSSLQQNITVMPSNGLLCTLKPRASVQ